MKDIFTSKLNPFKHDLDKLDTLYDRAAVLYKCNSVFPFDFFPNILIIDFNKVDIIYSSFFMTSQTVSILIGNINYVRLESSVFFSTLKIEVKGLEQNPQPISHLKNKDAKIAQQLIFGLMSAERSKIDLSHLPKNKVIKKLLHIGEAA